MPACHSCGTTHAGVDPCPRVFITDLQRHTLRKLLERGITEPAASTAQSHVTVHGAALTNAEVYELLRCLE